MTLPLCAHAADDFCNRLIILAVSQLCQLIPNGLNLCQPVALVGSGPECATPGRQALVPVGRATLLPPWTAAQLPAPATTTLDRPHMHLPVPAPAITAVFAAPVHTVTPVAEPATVVAAQAVAPPALPAPVVRVSTPAAPLSPLALQAAPAAQPQPSAAIVSAPISERVTMVAATTPAAVTPAPAPPPAMTTMALRPPSPTIPLSFETVMTPSSPVPLGAVPARVGATDKAATQVVDALAHFDFDSANLTRVGRAALDAWLRTAPKNNTVHISGHADRLGPDPYNLKLSQRRAEAVKSYLVAHGLNPRHVQIEARGAANQVKRCKGGATPATKACLAPNRRAVVDPK